MGLDAEIQSLTVVIVDPNRRHMLTGSHDKEKPILRTSQTFENVAVMTALRSDAGAWNGAFGGLDKLIGLENVLHVTNTFRSGDPRDKVFALVGIARSAGDAALTTPDYTLPVEQVFQNTARAIFSLPPERPSIHILALAGTGFSTHHRRMPSWVPDFSEERLYYPYSNGMTQDSGFRASGDLPQDLALDDETSSLTVKAITIDRVLDLSEFGMLDWGGLHKFELVDLSKVARILHGFVHGAIDLCSRQLESPDSVDNAVHERLWLTFIAGRIGRRPADVKFKEVFRDWLRYVDLMAETRDRSFYSKTGKTDEVDATIIYQTSLLEACFGRRIAITASGRLCIVPPLTKVGDSVIIASGSQTPFLIRQLDDKSEYRSYELVGEAWVEGVMHGEMIGTTDEAFIRIS